MQIIYIANDVTEAGSGFGTDTNAVTLVGKKYRTVFWTYD